MSLVAQHVLVLFSHFITIYWLYIWLTNEKIVINVSISILCIICIQKNISHPPSASLPLQLIQLLYYRYKYLKNAFRFSNLQSIYKINHQFTIYTIDIHTCVCVMLTFKILIHITYYINNIFLYILILQSFLCSTIIPFPKVTNRGVLLYIYALLEY